MAWYVTYCNGSPTTLRTYLAVTCQYDGEPHACSFRWSANAWDNEFHYEDRGNVNSNTGDDGFASTYGPGRSVTRCHTYELLGSTWNVGMAGVRFPDVNVVVPAVDFNPCV